MKHLFFTVGIPKRKDTHRHGNKLVAVPYLRNVTICGQEELWVFLSAPSLITSRSENVKKIPFSVFLFSVVTSPSPSHLLLLSHFSESTTRNQRTLPPHTDHHTYSTVTTVCDGKGSMASQPVNLTLSVLKEGKLGWAGVGVTHVMTVIFHHSLSVSGEG